MPVAHAKVTAVRVRYDFTEYATTVQRVVGYRFGCSCGARGPVRKTVADARADWREHECPDA